MQTKTFRTKHNYCGNAGDCRPNNAHDCFNHFVAQIERNGGTIYDVSRTSVRIIVKFHMPVKSATYRHELREQ